MAAAVAAESVARKTKRPRPPPHAHTHAVAEWADKVRHHAPLEERVIKPNPGRAADPGVAVAAEGERVLKALSPQVLRGVFIPWMLVMLAILTISFHDESWYWCVLDCRASVSLSGPPGNRDHQQ